MRTPHHAISAVLALGLVLASGSRAAALPDPDELRGWIEEMKTSPKGPFQAIKWFCADGTAQPPKAYACASQGGGNISTPPSLIPSRACFLAITRIKNLFGG